MFTGIVSDVGRVLVIAEGRDARRFEIASTYDPTTIDVGASIAHAGCCLTVIERWPVEGGAGFAVEASSETLEFTTLGAWAVGDAVNLERALKAGDDLGGHLMTGHVDGVGAVRAREAVGGSIRLEIEAPGELVRFIAAKGSIGVDGVSLTVNRVEGASFEVNVIPHTGEVTTLGQLQSGARVNLEVDLVARYLARIVDARQ
ncbi:MAG: riboflavin synthase [Maricaulaceae bacterium]|jgi:riboflavin synthase